MNKWIPRAAGTSLTIAGITLNIHSIEGVLLFSTDPRLLAILGSLLLASLVSVTVYQSASRYSTSVAVILGFAPYCAVLLPFAEFDLEEAGMGAVFFAGLPFMLSMIIIDLVWGDSR